MQEYVIILTLKNGQSFRLGYNKKSVRDSELDKIKNGLKYTRRFIDVELTDDNTELIVAVDSVLSVTANTIPISELQMLESMKNKGEESGGKKFSN